MRQYNTNLLATANPETRGGWWRRSLKIAGADIIGAGGGIWSVAGVVMIAGISTGGVGFGVIAGIAGAICGTAASLDAYDTTEYFRISPEILYEFCMADIPIPDDDPVLSINYPERFEYLADMGRIHNMILRKIDVLGSPITRGGGVIIDDPFLNQPGFIVSGVGNIVLTEAYAECYDNILSALFVSKNADETINVEEFHNTIPIMMTENVADIYSLFLDLYSNYPESPEEMEMIINNYIAVIEASPDFADREREAIYMGFSIAASSPFYWAEKFGL